MSEKKKLVCIVGESGSGKDSLLRMASMIATQNHYTPLVPVVSYTTRPKRENETDGVEHYFITKEEAKKMLDTCQILAYTKFEDPNNKGEGYEYFTTVEGLADSNVYIINPDGIDYLKSNQHLKNEIEFISIYIHTPSFIRKLRVRKRSDYKTKYKDRVKSEREQFRDFVKKKKYDYKIENVQGFANVSAHTLAFLSEKFLKGWDD